MTIITITQSHTITNWLISHSNSPANSSRILHWLRNLSNPVLRNSTRHSNNIERDWWGRSLGIALKANKISNLILASMVNLRKWSSWANRRMKVLQKYTGISLLSFYVLELIWTWITIWVGTPRNKKRKLWSA